MTILSAFHSFSAEMSYMSFSLSLFSLCLSLSHTRGYTYTHAHTCTHAHTKCRDKAQAAMVQHASFTLHLLCFTEKTQTIICVIQYGSVSISSAPLPLSAPFGPCFVLPCPCEFQESGRICSHNTLPCFNLSDKLSFYTGVNKSVSTETKPVYGVNLWLKWQQTRLAQQTDPDLLGSREEVDSLYRLMRFP